MTVYQIISNLNQQIAQGRLLKLKSIEAPEIIMASAVDKIDQWKNGTHKVNGLQRKYSSLRSTEVDDYVKFNTVTSDWHNTKVETVAVKFTIGDETYYYDRYNNKFGRRVEMNLKNLENL